MITKNTNQRKEKLFMTLVSVLAAVWAWGPLWAADDTVTAGEYVGTEILSGSLTAREAEHFTAPRTDSWRIQIKWMAKEGEWIKAGEPVVRFDNSDLLAKIDEAERNLIQKEEELKQRLATLKHERFEQSVNLKKVEAEYEKKKIDASVPKGLESNYKYDQIQLELKKSGKALESAKQKQQVAVATGQADVKKLELEIEEQRKKLENAQIQITALELKAQSDGTLMYAQHNWEDRKIQVGDTVFPTWPVATIPNEKTLEVEAWVNETGINRIKAEQKVDIFLDAYPEKPFKGTIISVSGNGETRKQWGSTNYFRVMIKLEQRDQEIMKPGMSVKCLVEVERIEKALFIPLQMVRFDGTAYRVKPKNQKPLTVTPVGFNPFFMILDKPVEQIREGVKLEPISDHQLKAVNTENKTENITENKTENMIKSKRDSQTENKTEIREVNGE